MSKDRVLQRTAATPWVDTGGTDEQAARTIATYDLRLGVIKRVPAPADYLPDQLLVWIQYQGDEDV